MSAASAHAEISFSIIIESENLGTRDIPALLLALRALDNQTIPLQEANEVVLVNTGEISETARKKIDAECPWIAIWDQPASHSYYEVKQTAADLVSGEVVLFCDCDVSYHKEWLAHMLEPFADDAVHVVTGETTVNATGPYSLFIQLAWCFPPHSSRREVFKTRGYPANNVAFRRALLRDFPIPTFPRLYRGNCSLHARRLEQVGFATYKAPMARATHPVIAPAQAPIRFFMWGHHEARIAQALHAEDTPGIRLLKTWGSAATILARRAAVPFVRVPAAMKSPVLVACLPLSLFLTGLAFLLFSAGMLVSLLIPRLDLAPLGTWLERRTT